VTAKTQEHEEITRAFEAIGRLVGEIEGAGPETLLSLLLALSVQGGALRDAAVNWYVALMETTGWEG
jgi:hypothetical protein